MRITIISVVLNDLKGLIRTLDSILCQNIDHGSRIEWVVVDGGSTDGTVNYLEKIKVNFPFHYKSETDKGIFDAMNKGVRRSTGQYILFLNAGDRLANSEALSKIDEYLLVDNPSLISGLVEIGYKSYSKITHLKPWVCHQSVFVKSETLIKYMFDEKLKYFGDLDLWKRMSANGEFQVLRVDVVVSKFELGGVGNSPRHLFGRLKERHLVGVRYKDKMPYVIRMAYSVMLYILFRIFGEDAYYRFLLR